MTLKLPAPLSIVQPCGTTQVQGCLVQGGAYCTPDDAPAETADARQYRSAQYGTGPRHDDPARFRDHGVGHAAGWCLRQSGAAEKLKGHWRAALPLREFPRSFGDWGGSGSSLTEDQVAECQAAWTAYDTAMSHVERDLGQDRVNALLVVVIHDQPSRLETAWLVRDALTYLADHWGLDDWGLEKR